MTTSREPGAHLPLGFLSTKVTDFLASISAHLHLSVITRGLMGVFVEEAAWNCELEIQTLNTVLRCEEGK